MFTHFQNCKSDKNDINTTFEMVIWHTVNILKSYAHMLVEC